MSEACRQRDVSKTQFYEYKRRFQTHGLAGLKDLPPIHKSHPFTTPPEVVDRILALSLEHPTWGCGRLHDLLQLAGISVSAVTSQSILNKHDLGSRYERLLNLGEQATQEAIELTLEQVAQIEKANPCLCERHIESSRPGELLAQDTFFVGTLKGVSKVYLHVVVDTVGNYVPAGSHAFGFLHPSKQPAAAVAVLHNDVLPFYRQRGLPVAAVLTHNGREFCGKDSHPYELYLELNDIRHKRTQVAHPQTNGFVERFNRTVLDEFFRLAFRRTFYESVEALQTDLDAWLIYYNTERSRASRKAKSAPTACRAFDVRPQLTAFFTSAAILASAAAVNSFSAKAVGHMSPSSRFASSLKPNVAYLALNLCALWKKQTTLPSLAYAGIPYQSFGERAGALALMIAWSRSPMARSGSGISAIFASTALSPSALSARGPRRASAFSSWRRSFIAARSSSVNPLNVLPVAAVPLASSSVTFFGLIETSSC